MDAMAHAQVLVESWTTLMSIVLLFFARVVIRKNDPKRKNIVLMCFLSIILFASDTAAYLVRGEATTYSYVMVRLTNFTVFFMNICLIFLMTNLLYNNLLQAGVRKRAIWYYALCVILCVNVIQLVGNFFTGHLYYFDDENLYHRSDYYFVFIGMQFLVLLVDLAVVIIYHKKLSRKEIYSYLAFTTFPGLSAIWIVFNYGISLTNLAAFTSMLIVVFMMALNDSENVTAMQDSIIMDFAGMVEAREEGTGKHIKRESRYVEAIGKRMLEKKIYKKKINSGLVERMTKAAPLHDIGKIVVSDTILDKPDELTPEEFEKVKRHTTEGMKLLSRTMMAVGGGGYMEEALDMAWLHHERWDGTGYPQGLKGEEIPVSARIMAVADTFDALVSDRAYRPAYSFEEAVEIIKSESGTHFDPEICQCFLEIAEEFREDVSF